MKTEWEDGAHNPLSPIYEMESSIEDAELELQLLRDSLIANGFFVTAQAIIGTRYFLLNKANFTQLLGRAFVASNLWLFPDNTMTGTNCTFPDSPKHSTIFPTSDGAKFTTKTSKPRKAATMSLLTYLFLLRETWQSGYSANGVQAPQRWIEALSQVIVHLEKGKVTAIQVYAWLNAIDFAQKATVI